MRSLKTSSPGILNGRPLLQQLHDVAGFLLSSSECSKGTGSAGCAGREGPAAGRRLPWSREGRLPGFPGGSVCRRDEIQARSWRRRKGQARGPGLSCPGSSLVCGAGRNSQGHGAVNFSATCPPSRGGEGLPSLPGGAALWLVLVQGHVSPMRGPGREGHLVMQSEQPCAVCPFCPCPCLGDQGNVPTRVR